MVILLQAVRQVLRIEEVTLLIRLVDRAVALVLRVRQLNYVPFVYVGAVLRVLTLVIRRCLQVIIHDLECLIAPTIDRPICVIPYVLVQQARSQLLILQLLVFFHFGDEGIVPQILHHGILNASPCQVLHMLLVTVCRLLVLLVVHVVHLYRLLLIVRILIV